MPKDATIRKVLVIGSGGIRIGQAAEFDYSGSQALKALREEHVTTVLVNPNVATIQTSPEMADRVYLEPLTPKTLERIIEKEKPDGILLGFGGQTALNVGVELAQSGVLKKHNVRVLGSPVNAITRTEDRDGFKELMAEAGIPVPPSRTARSAQDALGIAAEIGYPVIVRPAYTLGGSGSGVARDDAELEALMRKALPQSMIRQALVEKYLKHWKEVEYEVMRDRDNNCIIICNMENMDPMGVHTGDSVVVAPSQTLTNREYHELRAAAIRAIQRLGVVGECNIQFALDPKSGQYYGIEINARLSRSSALASKATGYPIAYVAAKLALGYTLVELPNGATGVTKAAFEPALDYVVVKMPRWDFDKFPGCNRRIGSQMKSVGEAMAIGRCFEEALQKAARCSDVDVFVDDGCGTGQVLGEIENPTDRRLWRIVQALRRGVAVETISGLSGIDSWFISKMKNIVEMERLLHGPLDKTLLAGAKRTGFSDETIARLTGKTRDEIRTLRKSMGITPAAKRIDTMAAEWPSSTNYLYMTYGDEASDLDAAPGRKVLVLGSGPIRIGSSVEFDWCTVNAVWALRERGIEAMVLNCNPETVSTDYDMSDKLFFDEITLERVLDVVDAEQPEGVIVSVGGQTPNNIAKALAGHGVRILGTDSASIDAAEDRNKFSALLDELGIRQPEWTASSSLDEIKSFADAAGYPVIVRPSYVLSGSAMRVAFDAAQLTEYAGNAARMAGKRSVVVSKFISGAREVETDGVCDGENVFSVVVEHVEEGGVHSGDAMMVIPPQGIEDHVTDAIKGCTERIARRLGIRGPFNVQYLVKNGDIFVIECNLRASRSMPLVSKATGFNLIKNAVGCMLGEKLEIPHEKINPVCVKSPMFSFVKLNGADPVLGVEMASTGEVACLGAGYAEALLKSMHATDMNIPDGGGVFVSVAQRFKPHLPEFVRTLQQLGYDVYTTNGNGEHLRSEGVDGFTVLNKLSQGSPNVLDYLLKRKIGMVVNVPGDYAESVADERAIRTAAAELHIPVITRMETASVLFESMLAAPGQPEPVALCGHAVADEG